MDLHEILSAGAGSADEIFRLAETEGIQFTPVTGISAATLNLSANRFRGLGIAIRVGREDYEQNILRSGLADILSRFALDPSDVDLIVDLGGVESMVVQGVQGLARAILSEIPDEYAWRNIIVSACAFPKSMGVVAARSSSLVERVDWTAWRDYFYVNRARLNRLPTFSDAVIQHPAGVEGFDPVRMQVSAAIRYARPEHWLLIKGESTRITLPSTQFPRLADSLVRSSSFDGTSHCAGCSGIDAASKGTSGYGSAEAWRRLGTIHHITTVVRTLAALPWP